MPARRSLVVVADWQGQEEKLGSQSNTDIRMNPERTLEQCGRTMPQDMRHHVELER